jgi:hypothetical protein
MPWTWRTFVPQPDVAALLTGNCVSEVFQRLNDTLGGYASRQPHAASTGINSSLT